MKKLLFITLVFLACSCASTMKMPDGCKPEKKVKHKMIKPTYESNPKKFKQGKSNEIARKSYSYTTGR